MPDSGQRTEKPTPRRLQRARREGSFSSSREFVSAVQFLGFVTLVVTFGGAWLLRTTRATRVLLARAFVTELTANELVALTRNVIVPELTPLLLAGGALVLLVLFAQLATTRLGISYSKLAPDFKRLNFLNRFRTVPAQNVPLFIQALLLLPLIGMVVYYEVVENLGSFLELPWMSPRASVSRIAGTLQILLWRAAGLFLVVGIVDLFWRATATSSNSA
jgi:flagellar biosynthesis protein FlhB